MRLVPLFFALAACTGDPPEPPELGVILHEDFEELRRAREALDTHIENWASALTAEWLG